MPFVKYAMAISFRHSEGSETVVCCSHKHTNTFSYYLSYDMTSKDVPRSRFA